MKKLIVPTALLVTVGIFGIAALVSARGLERVARLTGQAEVPDPGDEDGTGRAVVRMNRDTDRFCFSLRWRSISSPTAAHVHEGEAGQAGGPVATLFTAESPLPETINGVSGCLLEFPSADVVNGIINNPGNYYVNIHNADFPNGAIRGQLREPPERRG